MLADLETRLAAVLGQDLPAPLTGRVTVMPDSTAGPGPSVQLEVTEVTTDFPDFGSIRREIVPGSSQLRRVARLSCEIGFLVDPGPGGDRGDRVSAVDALIYFVDSPDFANGDALAEPGDPGFLLDRITIKTAHLSPDRVTPPAYDLTLAASGLFWPIGQAGVDGRAIIEARVRQLVLPLDVEPSPARFVAGSAAVDLHLRFAGELALTLGTENPPEQADLAFFVVAADGSPGAGRLTNGREIAGDGRARALSDGEVDVRYRPPAAPATDFLVIRSVITDGAEDRLGPELVRVPLVTLAGS